MDLKQQLNQTNKNLNNIALEITESQKTMEKLATKAKSARASGQHETALDHQREIETLKAHVQALHADKEELKQKREALQAEIKEAQARVKLFALAEKNQAFYDDFKTLAFDTIEKLEPKLKQLTTLRSDWQKNRYDFWSVLKENGAVLKSYTATSEEFEHDLSLIKALEKDSPSSFDASLLPTNFRRDSHYFERDGNLPIPKPYSRILLELMALMEKPNAD